MRYPRRWSSDTNFSSGTSSGSPTKVDPGAAGSLQGFVPGVTPFSPAQLNYLLNELADIGRYSMESHLHSVTTLTPDTAPQSAGTAGFAVVHLDTEDTIVTAVGGADSVQRAGACPRTELLGTAGTVTSVFSGALKDGTNDMVVVGTGGAFAAFSVDGGATWTDASSGNVARDRVVWDQTNGLYLASRAGQSDVRTSPTGATWTSRAGTGNNTGGIAVTSSGLGLTARGTDATTAFDRSLNGTTWTNTSTTIPDVASMFTGSVVDVAALGTTLYCAGLFGSGGSVHVRVFSSSDGLAWTLVNSIVHDLIPLGSPTVALRSDPYSGALYVIVTASDILSLAFASVDGGATWFGPARYSVTGKRIKASGGRLWMAEGTQRYMTTIRLPEQ